MSKSFLSFRQITIVTGLSAFCFSSVSAAENINSKNSILHRARGSLQKYEKEFNLISQRLSKELEIRKTLKKEHEGREHLLLELKKLREEREVLREQFRQLEQLKKRCELLMERFREKQKRLIAPDYLIADLNL